MSKAKQIPGDEGTSAPADDQFGNDRTSATDPRDAEIAALKAQLADVEAAKKLPQVVYEPETPHGAVKLAESEFRNLTTTQLMAKIKRGDVEAPRTGVLCADGWFAG